MAKKSSYIPGTNRPQIDYSVRYNGRIAPTEFAKVARYISELEERARKAKIGSKLQDAIYLETSNFLAKLPRMDYEKAFGVFVTQCLEAKLQKMR